MLAEGMFFMYEAICVPLHGERVRETGMLPQASFLVLVHWGSSSNIRVLGRYTHAEHCTNKMAKAQASPNIYITKETFKALPLCVLGFLSFIFWTCQTSSYHGNVEHSVATVEFLSKDVGN